MRISVSRAVVIILCAALLVASGALQAGAFISDLLFPSNAFDMSNSPHLEQKSLGNEHFFSSAFSMIPGVGQTTVQPSNSGTSIQDNGVHNSLKLPSIGTSWMGNVIAPAINGHSSQNVAMSSYQRMLGRYPNANNIFEA